MEKLERVSWQLSSRLAHEPYSRSKRQQQTCEKRGDSNRRSHTFAGKGSENLNGSAPHIRLKRGAAAWDVRAYVTLAIAFPKNLKLWDRQVIDRIMFWTITEMTLLFDDCSVCRTHFQPEFTFQNSFQNMINDPLLHRFSSDCTLNDS